MTAEKALAIFKNEIYASGKEKAEAMKIIEEAVEKQVAKKPIEYDRTNRADCPVCGAIVRGINKPYGDYCSGCGQKIDWSVQK